MGLFGKKYVPGITEYELKHKHVLASLDSVFPSTSSSSKIKRAALHTALGLAGDRDDNMSSTQKHGVIQKDEFESIVGGLENGGVITPQEAEKLRERAAEALSN
jgi:hypothetical protein